MDKKYIVKFKFKVYVIYIFTRNLTRWRHIFWVVFLLFKTIFIHSNG